MKKQMLGSLGGCVGYCWGRQPETLCATDLEFRRLLWSSPRKAVVGG